MLRVRGCTLYLKIYLRKKAQLRVAKRDDKRAREDASAEALELQNKLAASEKARLFASGLKSLRGRRPPNRTGPPLRWPRKNGPRYVGLDKCFRITETGLRDGEQD